MTDIATLHDVLAEPRRRAEEALTATPPAPDTAIAWLSAHLAAVEHVLEPALRRRAPHDPVLAEHATSAHRLSVLLRELELARSAGQVPAGQSLPPRFAGLLTELQRYAEVEDRLAARLAQTAPAGELGPLTDRYLDVVRSGPTRPHPWGVHHGRLERLTFTFDRFRDRVLDVLDARVVPVPRTPRRPPKPVSRWGHYALGGAPHDGDADGAPGS